MNQKSRAIKFTHVGLGDQGMTTVQLKAHTFLNSLHWQFQISKILYGLFNIKCSCVHKSVGENNYMEVQIIILNG